MRPISQSGMISLWGNLQDVTPFIGALIFEPRLPFLAQHRAQTSIHTCVLDFPKSFVTLSTQLIYLNTCITVCLSTLVHLYYSECRSKYAINIVFFSLPNSIPICKKSSWKRPYSRNWRPLTCLKGEIAHICCSVFEEVIKSDCVLYELNHSKEFVIESTLLHPVWNVDLCVSTLIFILFWCQPSSIRRFIQSLWHTSCRI